jgi:ketosteroid isomerase-like protein
MTTATSDAATIVRRLLEAFLAGDVETFMSYMDDDIELNTAEHHPFLTQYRGRQQFLDGVGKIAAELDGFRFNTEVFSARLNRSRGA